MITTILVVALVASFTMYEIETLQGQTNNVRMQSSYPISISGFSKIAASPTNLDGKVPVLYIGSLACPNCAELSWSIYSSLNKAGGSWAGLLFVYSNGTDNFPNTPGLSFANATYFSSNIVFYGYEISDRNWQPYQSLNLTDQTVFNRYDPSSHIPFLLIGNMYLHIGDFFPPSILSNTTGNTIMSWLNQSTSNAITDSIHNVSTKLNNVISELVIPPTITNQLNSSFDKNIIANDSWRNAALFL